MFTCGQTEPRGLDFCVGYKPDDHCTAVFLSRCVIGLPLLFVYHWDGDVIVQLTRAGVQQSSRLALPD